MSWNEDTNRREATQANRAAASAQFSKSAARNHAKHTAKKDTTNMDTESKPPSSGGATNTKENEYNAQCTDASNGKGGGSEGQKGNPTAYGSGVNHKHFGHGRKYGAK